MWVFFLCPSCKRCVWVRCDADNELKDERVTFQECSSHASLTKVGNLQIPEMHFPIWRVAGNRVENVCNHIITMLMVSELDITISNISCGECKHVIFSLQICLKLRGKCKLHSYHCWKYRVMFLYCTSMGVHQPDRQVQSSALKTYCPKVNYIEELFLQAIFFSSGESLFRHQCLN